MNIMDLEMNLKIINYYMKDFIKMEKRMEKE